MTTTHDTLQTGQRLGLIRGQGSDIGINFGGHRASLSAREARQSARIKAYSAAFIWKPSSILSEGATG